MFYNTARYAYASNHLVAYAGAHVVVLGTSSFWELIFLQRAFFNDLFDHSILVARAKLILQRCLRGTIEASLGSMFVCYEYLE